MKSKWALVIILAAALLPFVALSQQSDGDAEGWDSLSFELSADEESYAPMQLVTLKMKLTNTSDQDLKLKGAASVWNERIRIFIAREGEEFKEYVGPGWGLSDSIYIKPFILNPRQAYETEAAVLYQLQEKTSHLNPDHARRVSDEKIGAGYVLGLPGLYAVKAILYDSEFKGSKESNVIRITVQEPLAEDFEVINIIRSNPELGYFIQTGESPYAVNDKRTEKLVAKMEEIARSNPNGRYSNAINKSLAKFSSTKEKVKKLKAAQH